MSTQFTRDALPDYDDAVAADKVGLARHGYVLTDGPLRDDVAEARWQETVMFAREAIARGEKWTPSYGRVREADPELADELGLPEHDGAPAPTPRRQVARVRVEIPEALRPRKDPPLLTARGAERERFDALVSRLRDAGIDATLTTVAGKHELVVPDDQRSAAARVLSMGGR
jgi:hypothetical protein